MLNKPNFQESEITPTQPPEKTPQRTEVYEDVVQVSIEKEKLIVSFICNADFEQPLESIVYDESVSQNETCYIMVSYYDTDKTKVILYVPTGSKINRPVMMR